MRSLGHKLRMGRRSSYPDAAFEPLAENAFTYCQLDDAQEMNINKGGRRTSAYGGKKEKNLVAEWLSEILTIWQNWPKMNSISLLHFIGRCILPIVNILSDICSFVDQSFHVSFPLLHFLSAELTTPANFVDDGKETSINSNNVGSELSQNRDDEFLVLW